MQAYNRTWMVTFNTPVFQMKDRIQRQQALHSLDRVLEEWLKPVASKQPLSAQARALAENARVPLSRLHWRPHPHKAARWWLGPFPPTVVLLWQSVPASLPRRHSVEAFLESGWVLLRLP